MKIGDVVVYIGKYDNRLIRNKSYIIEYIVYDNIENKDLYYYLDKAGSYMFKSSYFLTQKQIRKQKLNHLNKCSE